MERHAAFFGPAAKLKPEEGWRRCRDPVRAAGKAQPVIEDKTDNLAETERDDRQIITVHTQDWKTEQRPGGSGHQRRDRQHGPETQPQILIAQREAIGANGVEGHVAQIQQTGQTDYNVES